MRAKIRLFSENSKLKIQHSLYHCLYAIMCFPFFLDLVNTLCFSFCVVFRITFAKVLFCAGDVKYFSIFFQFICRFIYKSLFLQKHTTLILYTEYGEWTS